MAKADLSFTLPVAPLMAFNALGGAMTSVGVPPFAQEGWSLKGQENMGLFKMGWPVTVIGTVGEDGRGGSTVQLSAENFGIALNRVHAESMLRKIGEAMQAAIATMPAAYSAPIAAPPVASDTMPTPEDAANLPPRIG